MSDPTLKGGLKLSVFDDMTVLSDPATGAYYTFNPAAGTVLEALAEHASSCDATRRLIEAYGLAEEPAKADVGRLLERLQAQRLLTAEAPAAPAPAPRENGASSRGHIVFLQELQHLYPLGGSAKVNRWYMERLVEAGYDVSVFCDVDTPITRTMLGCLWSQDQLEPAPQRFDDALEFWVNGVRLLALTENDCPTREQVARLEPTALVLSEDRTFARHEVAAWVDAPYVDVPTLWLATRPATLPFGHHAWNRSPRATELFQAADEIVVPNTYMSEYVRNWSGRESRIVPSPPFTQPRAQPGPHDGYVTLVNPSEIKGISVFLGLARKLPERRFAAVPGWSTTEDDLARLRDQPNVTLLRPGRDIAAVLESTSVLVTPSLWPESPGLLVTEAMLRSIPTVVSAVGSLPEVKMGVEHTLPVNPIEEYTGLEDGRGVAVPVIPAQDEATIDAWAQVVERLMSDRDHWERVAYASHAVALTQAEQARESSLQGPLQAMLDREPVAAA